MMSRHSFRTPPLGRFVFTVMERYPGSRLNLLSAPSHPSVFVQGSGTIRISTPITVAGQQRVCPTYTSGLTAFPHRPITGRHHRGFPKQSGVSYISPHEHVSSKKWNVWDEASYYSS